MSERKINLDFFKNPIQMMMLDFGKQLLELAAENATTKEHYTQAFTPAKIIINKQSILDTINQVE